MIFGVCDIGIYGGRKRKGDNISDIDGRGPKYFGNEKGGGGVAAFHDYFVI